MAKTGQLSGTLQAGEAGNPPAVSETVQINSPTITKEAKFTTTQAASTGPTALGMAGITNAVLVKLTFKDKSTGLAKNAIVTINTDGAGTATEVIPTCDAFFFSTQDTSKGIRAISITTESGNDTVVEAFLAGI